MSYDLMVFDLDAAPSDRAGFRAWYAARVEWSEQDDYNDPAVASPALSSWFNDIIQRFPPLNGPLSSDDVDGAEISDYSIGKHFIYVSFAWSEAANAYTTVFDVAKKHGLGFYDVSSETGEVWGKSPTGEYVCLHSADPAEAESLKEIRVYSLTAKKSLD